MEIGKWISDCLDGGGLPLPGDCSGEDALFRGLNTALKTRYRLNIVRWTPPHEAYPPYMLLGGDRGILAYIQYIFCACGDDGAARLPHLDSGAVLQTVCAAYSALDRPVFFVYLLDGENGGVFFETDEQIRDRWLSTGFSGAVYTPVPEEAGTGENLVALMLDLKKNNVHLQ